jgi:hypothetical protein
MRSEESREKGKRKKEKGEAVPGKSLIRIVYRLTFNTP